MEKSSRDKLLRKIPYGLYVVCSKSKEGAAAIIANWVTQVSFDPPLIAIAIEFDSDMRHHIEETKMFSVNMLPAGSAHLAKPLLKKSKQRGSTINEIGFTLSKGGVPFLDDAVDSIECTVVDSVRTGDHLLFVARVGDSISKGEHDILTLKETGWKYSR